MTWDEMMEEIKKSSPEALETIEKAQVYAKLLNEFVDKNAVMEAYCKDCPVEDCKDYCADVQWIFELPAADVVPVVRCKDCKWWKLSDYNTMGIHICKKFSGVRGEHDFCSRGETDND